MPTFREDLHLGHKVPTTETDDIVDKAITGAKIADRVIDWFHILAKAIRNEHIDDGAVDNRTLADDAVTTRNILNGAVTPEKASDDFVDTLVQPLISALEEKHDADVSELEAKDEDLQNQIDSFNEHGLSVSNEFGDDPHIGVSQKTLTDTINKLWQKIEDITGETLHGIKMEVTPSYFISEDGATLHIKATTAEASGIFEHIAFYTNGTLIAEDSNTDYFELDHHIDETTVIKCEAKILGIPYTEQHTITHYNSFFIGAGDTYQSVMDVHYVKPIINGMRGAYNVEVTEGQRLFIIIGESLRAGFIRADMNGMEIQFTESNVIIDGKSYSVLASKPWSDGIYNIDING